MAISIVELLFSALSERMATVHSHSAAPQRYMHVFGPTHPNYLPQTRPLCTTTPRAHGLKASPVIMPCAYDFFRGQRWRTNVILLRSTCLALTDCSTGCPAPVHVGVHSVVSCMGCKCLPALNSPHLEGRGLRFLPQAVSVKHLQAPRVVESLGCQRG